MGDSRCRADRNGARFAGFVPESGSSKKGTLGLLKNSIWLWDRLSSRSFQSRQRGLTGWKACPTCFFNSPNVPFSRPFPDAACLLIALWTGRKATLRSFEMVCFYMSGLADEEELLAHIEKLQPQD